MDSGNGSNQPQRYCPTPIMAPPSVATSPPIMSGGNIMSTIHQQTHHPPPSISPHPGSYYGHHTAGTSHYPTPSPTPPPPPMHHQQYYQHTHTYYTHGSHQQAQAQQQPPQQSQHHGIANTHVPINTAPGTAQPTSQHSHLMSHGSYHHQSQTHHQQWAPSTHPHQQQSHHYYHQPTHHPPAQQQPTQQHVYPPPPHSPYSYVQPHVPPQTPPPPPHTPHASQQHHQQAVQPQQHQHPPQVSVSPGPGQMHQTPPQQQPQSHALMNLSRFVSQQSPSPSPRASPSLAPSHHPQQMPQLGHTSPLPFSGHMEHHSSINGHTSNVGVSNNPVMSPPPAPIPSQQPISPTSPVPVPQHPIVGPPQLPYNINGGEVLERCSSAKINAMGSGDEHENVIGHVHTMNKTDANSNSNNKTRELPNVFSNITPSKIASIMNCDLKKSSSSPNSVTKSNLNSNISQNNKSSILTNEDSFVSESAYPGGSSTLVSSMDGHITPELLKDFGDSAPTTPIPCGGIGASCSPSSKPSGSPSSSGNGHQMMPVRLQNMHKGARTKANMKKLMQEQQITPNGQVTDGNSELVVNNAKEDDVMNSLGTKQTAEKPVKSPKKKRTQPKDTTCTSVLSNNSLLPMSPVNMDLTADSSISVSVAPIIRPGYTKSGKKIGRPRKDATQTGQPPAVAKPKKKREIKNAPKKSKKSLQLESAEMASAAEEFDNVQLMDSEMVAAPLVNESTVKIKRKVVKASRKRSPKAKVRNDVSAVQELPIETDTDLVAPPFSQEEDVRTIEASSNNSLPTKKVSKKRTKKSIVSSIGNSTDSSPDPSVLSTIPGSKISEQEAESVALRVIQSSPITTKGKRKGKKSLATPALDTPIVGNARRSKTASAEKRSTVTVVPKDVIVSVSPERSELPRLRSRSPKQRESPPLRISSPRAAKEKSSTPGSSTNQTSTSRYRASKDKEIDSTVTTPLASPSLRSPKKTSPEKDKETFGIRTSSRQKANETNHVDISESQKDLISPPLVKRSRKLSKESLDSTDIPKIGRRKVLANEMRLSSDSDRSPSLINKRVSRRKSGSVTGSVDNLSSPNLNQTSSSLSLIPSEGSLELPSDFSTISTTSLGDQHFVSTTTPVLTVHTASTKRRKSKKVGKTKGKSRRVSLVNAPEMLTTAGPFESVENDQTHFVEPEDHVLRAVKGKRSRKLSSKKGKRRTSTAATTSLDSSSGQADINEDHHSVHLSSKRTLVIKSNKKGLGRPKKQKPLPNTTLNIPVPAILGLTKKNVKFKTEEKTRKQPKKLTVKVEEPIDGSEQSDAYSEFTNTTKVENPEGSNFQDITPTKRRRYSITSATNTQVSAKLNTEHESEFQKLKSSPTASHSASPSNTPKTLRRDSRSVSRDYDVSVVLTDIVQTFTAGDTSLMGISTSFSRLQSPPTSSFTPSHNQESPIERNNIGSKVNEEISTSSTSITDSPKLKKRKQQAETRSDSLDKKKMVVVQPNQELQARKANLEAEIAMMLLELKTGASSKSPSPAKSILNVDVQEPISRKKTKSRKRKHSRSPRRSIDVVTEVQASVPEIASLDFSAPSANNDTLLVPHVATKGAKRKGSKGRRSSNARKVKVVASSLLSLSKGESISALPQTSNDNVDAPLPTTAVKVARTVTIPTASSLGINSPVAVTKSRAKVEKKKTPVKMKTAKSFEISPDITAISKAPLSMTSAVQPSASTATSSSTTTVQSSLLPLSSASVASVSLSEASASLGPIPKQKRKQSKKQLQVMLESGNQSTNGTTGTPVAESADNLEVIPKKKRQKKMRESIEPAIVNEAVPSTSTAALLVQSQISSTSKLFSNQISPKSQRKPTVLCKSSPFIDTAKDDDNQKKKAQDSPALKVVGGLTKFYRGGEIEEVDPDPKLPKEKAQLQTDNAVPWICSFCHLGPHSQKLGDLFGPYFADLPSIYGKTSSKRETWMHGDCALWAGSLLLIGTYLRKLEETLQDADQEACTVCGRNGATIGCLRRGCNKTVHYPCAVRRFWKMDEQNFHSYCPQHIP